LTLVKEDFLKIGILTPDSKLPNLAAMKISAYHKSLGHEVFLNFPLIRADVTYASVLFQWTPDPIADLVGGPKYPETKLLPEIDCMRPDYSLYPEIDYSIGYTYKACPRTCEHCIVPKQQLDDKHYSIWEFHETRFNKIMLMNNNTFADPDWRDTFLEIEQENLIIMDQNGYDLRLVGEEQAHWLKRLRFDGLRHFAWDYPEHEIEIMTGLCNLKKAGINQAMVYVMIGHTTPKEDLDRASLIDAMGFDPFVMPLNKRDLYQKRFARWCNHKAIFKSVRWESYRG
jgi:hypothetical protein